MIQHNEDSMIDHRSWDPQTTGPRIHIDLPLPPQELKPNARSHWTAKAHATKRYRQTAWAIARSAIGLHPPRWTTATCQATFRFPTRRRRDRDNLLASLKSAFDGIADAGIVANDAGLIHLPVAIEIASDRPAQVTLTICEAHHERITV